MLKLKLDIRAFLCVMLVSISLVGCAKAPVKPESVHMFILKAKKTQLFKQVADNQYALVMNKKNISDVMLVQVDPFKVLRHMKDKKAQSIWVSGFTPFKKPPSAVVKLGGESQLALVDSVNVTKDTVAYALSVAKGEKILDQVSGDFTLMVRE